MVDIAQLGIRVDASQVNQATTSLNNMGRAGNSAAHEITGLTSASQAAISTVGKMAGLMAGLGLVAVASDIFKVNREMQSLRASLETVTGSSAGANAAFKQIQSFAAVTPFTVQQVTEAFIKLNTLGLTPSNAALTSYGNTASAMGKSLNQMIEAVADAATGQFERLKEFGIKSAKSGDDVVFTFKGVETTVKNSAENIQNYLMKIGNTDFAGGMDRQAKTIDGALSTLGDSWSNLLDQVISPSNERMIASMITGASEGINAIANIQNQLVTFGDTNATVGNYVEAAWLTVKNSAMGFFEYLYDSSPRTMALIGQAASFIGDVFGAAWRQTKDIAIIAFNAIVGGVNGLGQAIGVAAAGIVQVFAQAFEKVKSMAGGLGLGVEAALSGDFSFKDLSTAYNKQTLSFKQVTADVSSAFKSGFQDYAGNIGKTIGDTASQLHSLDTIIESNNAKLVAGAKAAKDHGAAHTEAAGGVGKHSKAQQEANKFLEEGTRLAEQLITPTEKYNNQLETLHKQLDAGNISQHNFDIGLEKANEELLNAATSTQKLSEAQQVAKRIIEDTKTPQETYNEKLIEARRLYEEGLIPLKVYIDYVEKLGKALGKTTDEASVFKRESETLSKERVSIIGDDMAQYDHYLSTLKDLTDEQRNQLHATKAANIELKNQKEIYKTIFDSAKSAFDGILNQGKSFADALKGVFDNMVAKIQDKLWELASNNAFNGNWGGFFGNIIGIGASYAAQWLSKSNTASPVKDTVVAQNPNVYGVSSMYQADTAGRDVYVNSSIETIRKWNAALNDAASLVRNNVGMIADYASKFFSSLSGSFLGNLISTIKAPFEQVYNYVVQVGAKVVDGVSNLAGSATSAAGSAASSGASGIASYAGQFLAVIKLGWDLVEIAGNKFTTTLEKVSNGFYAAETAAVSMLGVANPIAWAVGAVLRVAGAVTQIASGDLMGGASNLLGGHIGGLIADMFKPKPSATMLSYSQWNKESQWDQSGQYFTSKGPQSASIGVKTPFGYLDARLNDVGNVIGANEVKAAFLELLQTTQKFDNALGDSIIAVDKYYGQSGTLDKFNANLKQFEPEKLLKNLDSNSFVVERFNQVIGKGLESVDTIAGKTAGVWINAFSKVILDPKKPSTLEVFNIEDFVSKNLLDFTKIPLKLADLFVKNVKSISDGATQEQFLREFTDFFAGWEIANQGLKSMGTDIQNTAIPEYLASLTGLGFTVKESAIQLVSYAKALQTAGQYTNETMTNVINSLLDTAKNKDYNKDQVSGFTASAMLIGGTLTEMKLKPSQDAIVKYSSTLVDAAVKATSAANAEIDKTIATEKLTNISREAAIQQLVLSNKLNETTIKAADFSTALTQQQQTWADGINVIQTALNATGTKFEDLGISIDTANTYGQTLTATFGTMKDAMNELDSAITTLFGENRLKTDKYNAAYKTQEELIKNNPELATAGLYAGMNKTNLQAATSAAENTTGFTVAQQDAWIRGNLTNPYYLNVIKPFIDAVNVLSSSNDVAPTGYKYGSGPVAPSSTTPPSGSGDTYKLDPFLADPQHLSSLSSSADQAVSSVSDLTQQINSFMQPFRDASATRGMDELQKLNAAYKSNLETAEKLKVSTADLDLITQKYNDDVAALADKLNKSAIQQQITLLDLQGDKTASLNLTRQQELNAMDASLRPMQQRIYALQDEKARTEELQKSYDKVRAAALVIVDFKQSVSDWVASHKSKDIGSPLTQLNESIAEAQKQYNLAKGGDQKALGKVTGVADTLLSNIDKYYGSSAQGQALKQQVMSMVSGLPDKLSIEDILIKNADDQIKAITGTLPAKLSALDSQLLDKIVAIVGTIDITANIPEDLKKLAASLGSDLVFTVKAVRDSSLPKDLADVAFGITSKLFDDYELIVKGNLSPELINMGIATLGVLNKNVMYYVTNTGLTPEQQALGLGVTSNLLKYAEFMITSKVDAAGIAMGLNVLGVANKYTQMIINSSLDAPAKLLKLGEVDKFVKDAWLSISTTGNLTADQQLILNMAQNQTKSITFNTVVNAPTGSVDQLKMLFAADSEKTFNAVLGMVRSGELSTPKGLEIFDNFFKTAPLTTFNATLSAVRAGILTTPEGLTLFDRMFQKDPTPTFFAALGAYKQGLLSTDEGLTLFNRMFATDPMAAKTAVLNAIAGNGLTTAEGQALLNSVQTPTTVEKVAKISAVKGPQWNDSAAAIGAAGAGGSATITANATLTLDSVLNDSILSYSKSDVALVYSRIANAVEATANILNNLYANLNSGLGQIGATIYNGTLISQSIERAAWNTDAKLHQYIVVQSESRGGPYYTTFASGGIATEASIFGEAGPEAAVPLPDGRTIPVTLSGSVSGSNKETVEELKNAVAELRTLRRENGQKQDAIVQRLAMLERRLSQIEANGALSGAA